MANATLRLVFTTTTNREQYRYSPLEGISFDALFNVAYLVVLRRFELRLSRRENLVCYLLHYSTMLVGYLGFEPKTLEL